MPRQSTTPHQSKLPFFLGHLKSRKRVILLTGLALVAVLALGGWAFASPILGFHDANGSKGGYWSNPETAFAQKTTVTTDSRTFHIGDAITMPNGLQLQVTRVERNWQPSAAVANGYGRYPDGDDPTGREVVLVWFTATNRGSTSIGYADSLFSLRTAHRPEQRVARLATLLPTSYGSMGAQPWLLPGETKTTFVPFLVTPQEALLSFQYYQPAARASSEKSASAPYSSPIYRLSIDLTEAAAAAQAPQFQFAGDTHITVG